MRVWILRVLIFLLLTLGASVFSVMVYEHTVERGDMLEFRTRHRSEVLKNVGWLLLEWNMAGAEQSLVNYLREQREHGRVYTLFGPNGQVLAGASPDGELLSMARQALHNKGYAFEDKEGKVMPPPPMMPPQTEVYAFLGRDNRYYALGLRQEKPALAPLQRPEPMLFIIFGACIAVLVLYALFRISKASTSELRTAMRRLAQGDFKVRVDSSLQRGKDNFSQLAKDFNDTVTRLADKQAEQRFLISEFTHEMRSPLTRMALAMEFVRTSSPERTMQLLGRIKADSEELNALFEQLMAYVREQWDQSERRPLQLTELLRPLAQEFDNEARVHGKGVVFSTDGECQVLGNDSQLASMVRNVLRNAVRHTSEQTEVHMCLECLADEGVARIAIEDHGPGLPEDMLEKVFEPFQQEGDKHEGLGLGLAIARLVSERHGGSITLANRSQGGLRAVVVLPLMETARQPAEKSFVNGKTKTGNSISWPRSAWRFNS